MSPQFLACRLSESVFAPLNSRKGEFSERTNEVHVTHRDFVGSVSLYGLMATAQTHVSKNQNDNHDHINTIVLK